jgi:hypothetical protein
MEVQKPYKSIVSFLLVPEFFGIKIIATTTGCVTIFLSLIIRESSWQKPGEKQ